MAEGNRHDDEEEEEEDDDDNDNDDGDLSEVTFIARSEGGEGGGDTKDDPGGYIVCA
jgi:hypothetical protein